VRWSKRKAEQGGATLSVENVWKLGGDEVVAREKVTLRVLPADEAGRAIDIEIVLQAVGGSLELRGAPDQNKGYGGLCLRGAPLFTGAVMTTDKGPLEKDVTNVPYRWADISTPERGVAVFVSPDHPGVPVHWLIRNSYAGVLNPSWPGNDATVLEPGHPVSLRYRIYVHRGLSGTASMSIGGMLSPAGCGRPIRPICPADAHREGSAWRAPALSAFRYGTAPTPPSGFGLIGIRPVFLYWSFFSSF
jgi:hypothetical protein